MHLDEGRGRPRDVLAHIDRGLRTIKEVQFLVPHVAGDGVYHDLAARDLRRLGFLAHRVAGTRRVVVSTQVRPGVWRPVEWEAASA